ncbi:cochaperone prefoldin complex subunit, putative [Plasmodium vivax]|uniref:Prefoldin subunit 5, putative n=6 Tax=Plasmodium vivax TaxID=5855 RepID=A5K4U3_PLAVS|nr:prefoldin subunit 5, putative [Plasmodium vivax]KMZ80387.1 prefoldin subunit 5 [Plasmodium vivax India VII]KMZ86635.1 prefoldin subunit 5 [Plasmodium vivax Brazil I]KMZ93085.1 prefoldin subunit 5 [Plasmodium vivax Mauritania I]KMZ99545.1 prefoldin subunit 5 [Plasmodium vivax North Korean]EDL45671.1 prefoldin subunit 5, putative [Plasmodium vivax]|eukprot:XP_001615398.1 prefoldin subunit 5 [Plasmodium vivax Sal-1]
MACDLEKIEEKEREQPNVVIQLNALGLDELISLTLKLEEEWKQIKKNYAILEGAVVTYDKCKNSVEQLNPSKFEAKNFNAFMNELERSELIKLCNKEQSAGRRLLTEGEEPRAKDSLQQLDTLIDQIDISKKDAEAEKKALDVHIPLTSLVYIPGKIVDTENFLIRMGTNYYVQRNAQQTIEYFNTKIGKLNEQIKKLKITIIEKKNEIDLCKNYIQLKRQMQMTGGGAAPVGASANGQQATPRAAN